MSILSDAINAERANRQGSTDTAPARKPATNANEIDPARVAALAAELVGNAKAEDKKTSYRMNCPSCGAAHAFTDDDLDGWKTDDEASETDGDDENGDDDTDDSDPNELLDDDNEFEDRKNAAVKAAVLAERQKHLSAAQILAKALTEQRR